MAKTPQENSGQPHQVHLSQLSILDALGTPCQLRALIKIDILYRVGMVLFIGHIYCTHWISPFATATETKAPVIKTCGIKPQDSDLIWSWKI